MNRFKKSENEQDSLIREEHRVNYKVLSELFRKESG